MTKHKQLPETALKLLHKNCALIPLTITINLDNFLINEILAKVFIESRSAIKGVIERYFDDK